MNVRNVGVLSRNQLNVDLREEHHRFPYLVMASAMDYCSINT
ncbi:hypothetical protein Enr10x_15470 [Gimesia panareensis]|uniref:Uncharacterized protein n=1 Tax=Gimesia panareensis TaxID=2527978 RepID=A0A517Q3N9_9PLAN|nr:hypothetical protein Enr10x_15470 [Gimesia panareensis]